MHIDKLESLGLLLVMIQAYKVRIAVCVSCAFFSIFISVLALSTVSLVLGIAADFHKSFVCFSLFFSLLNIK